MYYTASGIVTLCRWPSGAQVERGLQSGAQVERGLQSKHVEEYNTLIIKQEFMR